MNRIPADDPRLTWSGAVSLEQRDGWVKPWRVPHTDLDLYSPSDDALAGRAEMPSGVRLRFGTNAQSLQLDTEPLLEPPSTGAPGPKKVDLYANDVLAAQVELAGNETTVRFDGLAPGTKTLDVWLPQGVPFALRALEVPDDAQVYEAADDRPRWVVYGSSITHCRTAGSPSLTWPAIVARAKGLNLTSLGLGGQCHADPMLARLIRDLPADLVTIKIGINVYGSNSLNARTFRPAVLGTIATIRDGHPDVPFVVCSPIYGVHREDTANDVGMTLRMMRDEVREAVESFKRRGDTQLFYVDGLKLFDESLAGLLPDNLHPNTEGYALMGQHFLHEVFDVQGVGVTAAARAAKV